MGLAAWFNKVRAGWQRDAELALCKKHALAAIKAGDEAGLQVVLAHIQPHELDRDEQENLLKAAIDNGDAKTFAAVLAFTGDPNETIEETVELGRSYIYYHHPLLSYATRVGSHDIALALASDPRTDIEKLATRNGNTPLFEAKRAGMQDVAAVLMRRTAELRRQDAARWDAEAARLAPATQPT